MNFEILTNKIQENNVKYEELERKVEKLYDDWISKRINENNFQRILKKTQNEQNILLERIQKLKSELEIKKINDMDIQKWITIIKKYKDIKELNKEILNDLIQKIYVYEKEVIYGEITQIIEIHYNFIGTNETLKLTYNL